MFSSPMVWVVFALLQLSFAYLFLSRLEAFLNVQAQLNQLAQAPGTTELVVAPTFGAGVIIMLIITPLLSMRSIAEERVNQTFAFIMSSPISMTEIVLGKFLGLLALLTGIVATITATTLSLLAGGTLDLGLVLSNTLGMILICACFGAIGIYISTLTSQPLVAATATLSVLLGLWLIGLSNPDPGNFLNQISLVKHFDSFNQGLLDSGDIVYLIIFLLTFLVLSIHRLHRNRLYG